MILYKSSRVVSVLSDTFSKVHMLSPSEFWDLLERRGDTDMAVNAIACFSALSEVVPLP